MEIVGIDFSPSAISGAKVNSRRFHVDTSLFLADAKYLPFRKEAFNLVWNMGVLEHYKEPSSVMGEMVRVTENEGTILVFVPTQHNILVKIGDAVQKIFKIRFDFDKAWGGSPSYPMDLQAVFAEASLTHVRVRAVAQELFIETMAIGCKRSVGSFSNRF